jgi:pimeloyl-ACP methyl ester carboxylesterase
MPFVERNGASIHWTALGQGEPVVLIMGLGCSSALWFRIAPQLARQQRVILIDNRGSGLTRVQHYVVHRVQQMAADVAAVLDAAGEFDAHIVGFSMGGMIAQQFALDFPQRLRSLALLGTHSGGPWVTQAAPQVRQLLFDKTHMSAEDSLRAMRPYTYARDTSDELFDEDSLVRLANQPSARDYQAQLYALIGWSVHQELPRLQCPTLVMHGLQDQLVPPANGRRTAERIAGARLIELPGASHWLMTDQNAHCLAALREHIDRHTPWR